MSKVLWQNEHSRKVTGKSTEGTGAAVKKEHREHNFGPMAVAPSVGHQGAFLMVLIQCLMRHHALSHQEHPCIHLSV
jgi:hypothetical protein